MPFENNVFDVFGPTIKNFKDTILLHLPDLTQTKTFQQFLTSINLGVNCIQFLVQILGHGPEISFTTAADIIRGSAIVVQVHDLTVLILFWGRGRAISWYVLGGAVLSNFIVIISQKEVCHVAGYQTTTNPSRGVLTKQEPNIQPRNDNFAITPSV